MSESGESKATTAKQRAAQAAVAAATAQARERRAKARADYDELTQELLFVKEFHSHNLAIMQDPFEVIATRVLTWARRYAWGEYSLFAIAVDGQPKYQVDCCRELGLKPRTVSKAVKYLQQRGYLEDQPKLIIPVIAPVLSGPAPEADAKSPEWGAFLALWEVAHSTEFEQLEVARATVNQIRKVRLSEYKKWREQETKARASLLEIARQQPDHGDGSKLLSPYEENLRRLKAKAQNRPVEEGMQSEARKILFAEIEHMQLAYPKSEFANPPIDPQNPDHQNLVNLLLKKLGTYNSDYLVGFVVWVAAAFKGIGRDEKGLRKKRPPGSESGPKTLGLLVNWAEDYVQKAGKP